MAVKNDITEEEVKHIAKLSRIALSDDEVKEYTKQITDVFDYMHKLDELDIHDVQPTFHPILHNNRLRNDDVGASFTQDEALSTSSRKEDGYFKVQAVIN